MTMKDLNKHRLLEALGLAERPSGLSVFMGTLTTFALGALVGAGFGLLSAPRPGRELRGKLRKRFDKQLAEIEQRIHS
jgi:gas vesicle protein